jgi:hypothetical protein
MTTTTTLGAALILFGLVVFAYQGITYTTHNKIIDIGPIQATVDQKETIPLPPIAGGLALAGGVALLIMGVRKA